MGDFELMSMRGRTLSSQIFRCESPAKYELNWRGWIEYFDYWDGFIKDWYDSEACPSDEYSMTLSRLFKNKNEDARLKMGELPEPYYGNPHTAKGVIVSLNPGESDSRESSKFYPNGALIKAFAEECGLKYSEYSRKYSSLSRMDVCGSNWWHEQNRTSWMNRFFKASPEDIFALEACPYHSKAWGASFYDFAHHVVERVIAPALAAASENKIFPCAAFVGSEFSKLIAGIRGITKVGGWRGKRSYELYSYDFPHEQSCKRTVYAVAIDGVIGMRLPSDDAANCQIEDNIKAIISTGKFQSSSEVKVLVKDTGCKTSEAQRVNTLQRVHHSKRPQKLM